jgi:hypothetical protein
MEDGMKTDYLSKPDGNVLALLADSRVWSTAGGAMGGGFLEKTAFIAMRDLFGYELPTKDGGVVIVSQKAYDTAKAASKLGEFTSKDLDIPSANNRQFYRLLNVLAAVSVIEFTKTGSPSFVQNLQYAMLGLSSTAISRFVQQLVPAVLPSRR